MSCWLLSCNSVLSRLSSPPSWRLLARLLLLLALSISLSRAELIYQYEGQEERIPLTQLWYEGHWKELPPINGTITWNRSGDVRGKIVVSPNLPPHEASIREFQAKGAAAVLFYRIGSYPPGFSMYVVDGSNRGDIWLPVMEVTSAKNKHFPKLSEGAFVQCIPTENLHKKANDSKFQLVMNLVQSLWEMAIVFVAVYRLFQFYFVAHFPLFSIAPLCCTFEGVAAALRLAYTVVDPFYTYRMLDFSTSVVLVTISWPFSESAGILLTFFWAETISKSNVKALPFISEYKWAAIGCVILLFSIEIALAVTRAVFPQSLIPIYISCILAFLTEITLVACYLSAAIAIARRIGSRGKEIVRKMTIRIAVSCIGYVICIAGIISFAIFYPRVWGRTMTLNSIFLGLNVAGIMQVLALKPVHQGLKLSSAATHHSSKTASVGAESPH